MHDSRKNQNVLCRFVKWVIFETQFWYTVSQKWPVRNWL